MSELEHFYDGKVILITGVTGFLGKTLLEKLLRSCSGVNKIYVLIREREGKTVEERLERTLKSQLFDSIRESSPEIFEKVIPLCGDVSSANLGLSLEDYEILAESVSLIFHSAASVRFTDSLRVNVQINLLGTKSVIELAKKMQNLKSFVHVSTAYSNSISEVDELVYTPSISPQLLLDLLDTFDDSILETLTTKIIGSHPNTYTFVKGVTEFYLEIEAINNKLPISIVRPSIISAIWRKPIQGWVDNIHGATGVILAGAQGVLKTLLIKAEANADMIPVDVVSNMLIVAAWEMCNNSENNLKVYNCTNQEFSPIRWDTMCGLMNSTMLQYPSNKGLRYPTWHSTQSVLYNTVCRMFLHYLPAYIADALAIITFRKTKTVRFYEKFHKNLKPINAFTLRGWNFKSENVKEIAAKLNETDKKTFYLDIENIDWIAYYDFYQQGIRKFVGKEDPSTLDDAKKRLKLLYLKYQLINSMMAAGILGLASFLLSRRTKNIVLLLISLLLKKFGSLITLAY